MNGIVLSAAALGKIMPLARIRAQTYAPILTEQMAEFEINTLPRVAAFLGQIAVESGELRYTRELGSSQYLDKYDTGPLAKRLGNTPEDDDDGQKYCGRGLIQITGHTNYEACGNGIGMDLLTHPELLEQPLAATRSACWFWRSHNLSALADNADFETITRRINGGLSHYNERQTYYQRAKTVLSQT